MEAEERARDLLDRFATATGVTSERPARRYLWTDAFAVCTWLRLGERSRAVKLVDQVHRVLGRHRPDDHREGWISGLSEAEGARRPTAGGLRIGKPLPERGAGRPFDPRSDWERDGQYLHYLTKWMRALCRTAEATGRDRYLRWAEELGVVAFEKFAHGGGTTPTRLYWKMSIDLSRPTVASMGQHDALDTFVTLGLLRDARAVEGGDTARADPAGSRASDGAGSVSDPAGNRASDSTRGRASDRSEVDSGARAAKLDRAIDALAGVVESAELVTPDLLGAGALLGDARSLAEWLARTPRDAPRRRRILERVVDAAERSVTAALASGFLTAPATRRLAFRELGLAIGLARGSGLLDPPSPEDAPPPSPFASSGFMGDAERVRRSIHHFWLRSDSRRSATWTDHEDINAVMLAASLTCE